MLRNAEGFSLIELIAVIAVILILVGIAAPRIDVSFRSYKLDSDAKKLASNLALAQQYAIGQKNGCRYYGISFDIEYYRVGYYVDPDRPNDTFFPVVVPNSIDVSGKIPFSGSKKVFGPKNLIFQFNGSTWIDYSRNPIKLEKDNSIKKITITNLTGYVSIE